MTNVSLQAGCVGLFYSALISEAIRIRDAPVSSEVTVSINVVWVLKSLNHFIPVLSA